MPVLFIHAQNSKFSSRDEGADYETPELALAEAVKAAMSLATDEISRGERSASIVVSVEREDGTRLLSSIVTVSVCPLLTQVGLPR